jgi:hypothetical protein
MSRVARLECERDTLARALTLTLETIYRDKERLSSHSGNVESQSASGEDAHSGMGQDSSQPGKPIRPR